MRSVNREKKEEKETKPVGKYSSLTDDVGTSPPPSARTHSDEIPRKLSPPVKILYPQIAGDNLVGVDTANICTRDRNKGWCAGGDGGVPVRGKTM
ncbi:hypothetical protein KM043_016045 [Ampulex compressa]|nr:hypothetical protein KM043_016045 [Ampulex compressa]